MSQETPFEPFALVKETFRLAHVNQREEKHGDESKPGYDFKFSSSMDNSFLDKLHPRLRAALYLEPVQKDIESGRRRELSLPLLQELTYHMAIPRVELRVHDVDSEENDAVLGGGNIKKFKLLPKNGGSVEVTFTISYSDPDEEMLHRIQRAAYQDVEISVASKASTEDEQGDNFEQAEKAGKEPMSEARAKAEAQFKGPGETDSRQQDILTPEAVIASAPPPEAAAAAQQASNVTAISGERKKRVAGGGAGAVE